MPNIQSGYGKISVFEDFNGLQAAASLADATAGTRWNDLCFVAISGQSELAHTVDESGGVISFNGAGGAADGIAVVSSPLQPSTNGPIVMECRFKYSSATDGRVFVGWQETVSLSETVNPYTLNGTTLTANAAGNVVGFYFDSQATTIDFRFMAGTNSAAATTGALAYALGGATTLGSLGVRCNATATADSWCIARVEINTDGSAVGYFGHTSMANKEGLTLIARLKSGVISSTALYYPHGHFVAQSTGDPIHELDYFGFKGNRDWAA